jgi:phosphoribosyl 1,2-cyclic phosphate phosphodiesterase
MEVYANEDVEKAIKRDFHYSFDPSIMGGVPRMNITNIHRDEFVVAGVTWLPLPVLHGNMEVLGFRIGDFAYVTDVNFISEETFAKLKGVKVLVISALMKTSHHSHYSLAEVLEVIEKILPDTSYLTHMSHLMGLHRNIQKELPQNVYAAYDGLVLENS